jgi:hypothetical protein
METSFLWIGSFGWKSWSVPVKFVAMKHPDREMSSLAIPPVFQRRKKQKS